MTTETPPAPAPAQQESVFKRNRGRPQFLVLPRGLRWLNVLGPGLITGAADDDPSGIATYSQAGAAFGTGQLWLGLYMLPLLIAVQEMSGRIGLVTGKGIAACIKQHYSRKILFGAVLLVVVANTINVGADLGAIVAAVRLFAPQVPALALLIFFALGILALEVFVPYRRYAIVLKFLAFSLLAYIVTGIIIGPHGLTLLRASIIPSIQLTPTFLALVVGVLGTTISPYLFFWQASEEVQEQEQAADQVKKDKNLKARSLNAQIRALRVDTVIGMVASEITTWFIIFTTGSVLFTHGITTITTADQAARALEPLVKNFPHAGEIAKLIFSLGIVGTGLLAIPILAGSGAYAVAEAFDWREGLEQDLNHARGFYIVIAAATLVGLALNLIGVNPIAALVYTAVINGIVAVPLLVLILLVANNSKIMGEHINGRLSNVVGIITTLAMGAAAIVLVISIFWHS